MLFAGEAISFDEMHPMHTGMSVVEHYVRCYAAPCRKGFRTLPFGFFLPLSFLVITAALYWKRRVLHQELTDG